MGKVLFLTVACIFALAVSMAIPIGDTYAEEIDYETGAVLSEDMGEGVEQQAINVTLIITSSIVRNGEVFPVTVNYFPTISGTWREKFIFNWPSSVGYFDEKTIRIKKFKDYSAITASSESVVAPQALGIRGTFEAKVKVIHGPETYKAKTSMTVVNP